MAERLVPLGELATTHGLDGWVKLNPFNLATSTLVAGREVHLDLGGMQSVYPLEAVKPYKKQFLVKFAGIDHIDAAARLIGATLSVDEELLDTLAPGQYYHYQVIGFTVVLMNGEFVGRIESLIPTAGGEIYVVKNESKEYLIPAVKEIVAKVDFSAQQVTIDPPDGLLDL